MKSGAIALFLAMLACIAVIAPPVRAVNVCCPRIAANNGQITVFSSGKPQSGAQVEFTPQTGATVSFVTGQDGVARTKDLRPGYYTLTISSDEGLSKRMEVEVADIADSSPLIINLVTDPAIQSNLSNLPNGLQIPRFAGRVTDPSGAVVAGARIRVVKRAANRLVILRVKSDQAGMFHGKLEEGSYVALISSFGFETAIVPFEITKSGSAELGVQLHIGQQELPTT